MPRRILAIGGFSLGTAFDELVLSGGNTANALAVWRVHGFDAILREALETACGSAVGARG